MPPRRALRFIIEALFLALLAAALTVADLDVLAIGALMLAGWVVVALFEWAAGRERAHYGSGLPPRYYVPQVSLPPARPLEHLRTGYPAGRLDDDTPTWIATPAMRAEMFGEWPGGFRDPAGATREAPRLDDTVVVDPVEPLVEEEPREDGWLSGADGGEPAAELPPEAGVIPAAPDEQDVDDEAVSGAGDALEVELAVHEDADRDLDAAAAGVDDDGTVTSADGENAGTATAAGAEVVQRAPVPTDGETDVTPSGQRAPARYYFDPFGDVAAGRGRGRRRRGDDRPFVEVAAGPPEADVLPGQAARAQAATADGG